MFRSPLRLRSAVVRAALGLAVLALLLPVRANVTVVPAQTVPMPGSGAGGASGGGRGGESGCFGNACVPSAAVVPMPAPSALVPMPVPARLVPWAQSVYWSPPASASSYGSQSLANIDAYLANQCLRSGNRQYYCKGSLNAQQLDWIQRIGQVQLQQTHIRWGNSWTVR